MGRVEQRAQGRSARAQPPVGIIGRSVARQHVRAEPLLPRRRDGADDRSGARVRIQDPLVPPRCGAVQDGRRGGVVRRSVLGLLEGRAGLQRRLARVRPRRSRAPAAHRLRAGRSASARERPMIALLLAQTIAITGGTVYPVSGPKLANATVLIRDGRIVAVGTNVSIPSGATRIDAAGKWITPGLIDGTGQLGLVEISAVPGTR